MTRRFSVWLRGADGRVRQTAEIVAARCDNDLPTPIIQVKRAFMSTHGNVQAVNIYDLKRYEREARVNQPLLSSKDLVTRMNCYEPGQITPLHMHPTHDEVVFCVEGRGAVTFEEREDVPLQAGTLVSLPAGLAHRIEAALDSRMVVIYTTSAGYTSVRPHAESRGIGVGLPGERK
jgi:quercetin dioxygenase-like cupin family protein